LGKTEPMDGTTSSPTNELPGGMAGVTKRLLLFGKLEEIRIVVVVRILAITLLVESTRLPHSRGQTRTGGCDNCGIAEVYMYGHKSLAKRFGCTRSE